MSDLYLILHKVRGEPAFDIAQRVQIGDEEGWIIPTSGHRAYPFLTWELGKLEDELSPLQKLIDLFHEKLQTKQWLGLPDHFTANTPRDPTPLTARVTGLLSVLGLGPKPIKRRSVT